MNRAIDVLKQQIEPLREKIVRHPVYSVIKDVDDLRIFMQYHVYAVWDFMSLLKTLQNNLTCTSVPWFPTGSADTRYLINEIVTGEESDVDINGVRISHFELYLQAMEQCGAPTHEIQTFINTLQQSKNLQEAFATAATPDAAAAFVEHTFNIIGSDKAHVQSAVFTFGREDLIPNMFISIINDINNELSGSIDIFRYYLERHIEVDGDHHSNLALQMTANLCGDNEHYWQEASAAVIASLQKRIELWNGVYEAIMQKETAIV